MVMVLDGAAALRAMRIRCRLLCNFDRVVDLDAEIANSALDLRVSK